MQKLNVQRLFVIACLLKVTSAVAGWYLNSPWAIGFIFPLMVMGLYILLGTYRRNDDVSKEKFADSCYYLGFIFTVTSISVALIDLPNIGAHIQDIAVRFGAAMLSTVLGLAVRVGMVTFQKDLNDAVRNAEEGVVDASIKFRDHLGLALERLLSFENAVDQASRLSVERVNLNVENLSKNHSERLSQFFADLTKGNQQAFEASLREVKMASQRLSDSVDGYAAGMRSNLDSIEAKVDAFTGEISNRLKTTTFPDDYFAKHLESPLAQLKDAADSVHLQVLGASKTMGESTAVLSLALKKLRDKAASTDMTLETVSKLATQQQALFDATQSQATALEKVSSTLSGVDGVLAAVVEELNTGSNRTAEVRDQLAQFLEEGTGALRDVTLALKEVAGDLSKSSTQNQQSFIDVQKTFDVAVGAYRTLSQRVDASTEVMTGKLLEGANATLKAAEHMSASATVTENAASKLEGVASADMRVADALKGIGDLAGAGLKRFDTAVDKLQAMVAQLVEVRRTMQQFTPVPTHATPGYGTPPNSFSYSAPESRQTLGERPAALIRSNSLEAAYAAAHPDTPAPIHTRQQTPDA